MSRCLTLGPDGPQVEPVEVNLRNRGYPNRVRTTRFTLISWLPKSLFIQLHRIANIYFVVVCILVCMPWSPVMWSATVVPFIIVLVWSALKDGAEDYGRKRDDNAENNKLCWRFAARINEFERVRWCDLVAGDILCVGKQESFPADLFLLYAQRGRSVFLSSANLDGETNWKPRALPIGVPSDLRERACKRLRRNTNEPLPEWAAKDPDDQPTRLSRMHTAGSMIEGANGQSFSNNRSFTGGAAATATARCSIQLNWAVDRPPEEAIAIAKELSAGKEGSPHRVALDSPTPSLWEAGGSLKLAGGSFGIQDAEGGEFRVPFSGDSLLPRGCILQGCPWIVAVAAYVGQDTKARLNATQARSKIPTMQQDFNRCLMYIALGLFCSCMYLMFMGAACNGIEFLKAVQYFILLYQMVPVSLYVCFECFKLLLAYRVHHDQKMYDPKDGESAAMRTSDIVEDLGQVTHVFSDKTGTLTENEMVLARVALPGGRDLGDFREAVVNASNGQLQYGVTNARSLLWDDCPDFCREVEVAELRKIAEHLFLCFALCNGLSVRPGEDGAPEYSGASPDEIALAEAAGHVGISLVSRKPGRRGDVLKVVMEQVSADYSYDVLDVVEFNSDRKRMSIILKKEGEGSEAEILCLTKGADNIMIPLLTRSLSNTEQQKLKEFSCLGLRTLIVASKHLESNFAKKWLAESAAAKSLSPQGPSGVEREKQMTMLAEQLETGLEMAGITAVEDRLQEGVPEAVASVRQAGASFWMLTGDKTETAIAIARSCQLITEELDLVYATTEALEARRGSNESLETWLTNAAIGRRRGSGANLALVLDGAVFRGASETEQGRLAVYQLSLVCRVCVCCRLSPMQKQLLIELVRKYDKMAVTLAIGDGANDVPMIIAAHVGVGVRGKEGRQSVQASDVAISQFRFLVPLMLCHGRQNYRRVGIFLCFFIYKHVIIAMGDLVWAHFDCFQAQKAYPEYVNGGYAIASSGPVFFAMAFDEDVMDAISMEEPERYKAGPARLHFNMPMFGRWMFLAFWHGSASWLVPHYLYKPGAKKYETPDFWVSSLIAFCGCVLCSAMQLMLVVSRRNWKCAMFTNVLYFITFFLGCAFCAFTPPGQAMQPELKGEVVPKTFFQFPGLGIMFLCPLAALVGNAIVLVVTPAFTRCPAVAPQEPSIGSVVASESNIRSLRLEEGRDVAVPLNG